MIDMDEDPDPDFVKIVDAKDKACVDRFYPLAMEKFEQMGLSREQIDIQNVRAGRRIGKAVADYARDNGYHTLVVGRRGINKAFFMGSVSRQVIDGVQDTGLWVVT